MCHLLENSLVSWHSKKHASVTLSTTEAEHVVAGTCCAQIICMKQQFSDYIINLGAVSIRCDNTSAINFTKNPILHSRTKHIQVRNHFIIDHVEKGECVLEFVILSNQLAYIFTKPLPSKNFFFIRIGIGILND